MPEFLDRHKGGRGRVDQVKAAAVATAKEHGISKRTVERAIAKTEAKSLPEPKPIAGPRFRRKPQQAVTGLEAARKYYLEQCKGPEVDLEAELEIVINALREIAGNKATKGNGLIPDCLHRRGEP